MTAKGNAKKERRRMERGKEGDRTEEKIGRIYREERKAGKAATKRKENGKAERERERGVE